MDGKNNEIRNSERAGITPGFLKGENDENSKKNGNGKAQSLSDETKPDAKKAKTAARNNEAAKNLGAAESNASGGLYQGKDSLAGTREKEEDGGLSGGFYAGKGKGKFKGKNKGKKGKSAFIAIILAICGVGGAMFGTQLFQPFSLVAQFQETFNSMSVSTTVRTSRFIKWQLGGVVDSGVKNPIRTTVFGSAKFKISEKQKTKLAKYGIDYDSSTGKMTYGDIEITADNFDSVYKNNADFHQAYNSGSKTWRGQFANWFGSTVVDFITNNNLTRNLFADFRDKVAAGEAEGKSSWDVFKETIKTKIEGGDSTGGVNVADRKDEDASDANGDGKIDANDGDYVDENGKVKKVETETNRESISNSDLTSDSSVNSTLKNLSEAIGNGVSIACGVANFVGSVSAVVSAAEMIQIINFATSTFETVDKVKAGDGDDAPINELGESLNTAAVSENTVVNAAGSDAETVTGKSKTAMQAAAVAALYSGTEVDASDASVQSFNLTGSIKRLLGGVSVTMTSFMSCAVAQLANSAVSVVASVFSAGASSVLDFIVGLGKEIAIATALASLIYILTPVIANMFTRDLVSNLVGEDFGNALASGANAYQGSAHRSTGGSLATEEAYVAYAVEQQAVIADQAQYERESLSPFDITSKYTFMGTLLTQLMSFSTGSTGTLSGIVKAASSAVSTSIASLSPTATAYEIAEVLPGDDYEETCPYLASIGAVGDAFCNPYIITDTSTMDIEPAEVIDQVAEYGGLETEDGEIVVENDNVKVDDSSNLAKYILYCGNRGSMFGIADYNIANEIADFGSTGNSAADTVIGAIPIISDVIDIANNASQLANIGWISGSSCVTGGDVVIDVSKTTDGDVDASESAEWSEAKYYQRFIEDQALAESMGLIDESAATAYYREYLEENPLDNSYEGILARYSGQSKETVATVLDFVWYAQYIENYDPSERYAFGEPKVEIEETLEFDNENVLAAEMLPDIEVIYADVRNRSFVA